MAGDRIDIEVVDKINAGIAKKLERIAIGADSADASIRGLKNTIKTAEGGSLRLAQAQNALSGAQIRMRAANERLNVIKQKGTATSLQLAAAENRLTAAQLRVRAASERVTMAIKKDAIAKQVAAAKTARLTSATNRMAVSQNRARAATRGLNTDLGMMLRTGLAFAGAGFGAGAIIRLGESYTMLQNKLRNVTDSTGQLGTVTSRVFEIANSTRSSVDATAQAFQRFDLALMQLGASQSESLRLTETVNKQLIVSGAATSEQASALLQLSQAFNKGKLDGDEFRSVMELMPPVADAIAKQLNVTRGELLKLAPDGVITAQVMRDALANAADDVDAKFAKTIPTIGQSFVVLKNKAVQFFGELDAKYGITKKISEIVMKLAGNMDILAVALGTVASMVAVAFGPQAISGIGKFFTLMASNPWGAAVVGLSAIVGLMVVFQSRTDDANDSLVTMKDRFTGIGTVIKEKVKPAIDFLGKYFGGTLENMDTQVEFSSEYFHESYANAVTETSKELKGLPGFFKKVFDVVGGYLKTVGNYWISLFKGTYDAINGVWSMFPGFMKNIFFMAVNQAIKGINFLIRAVTIGMEVPVALLNQLLEKMGKSTISLGEMIKIPEIEVEKNKVVNFFNTIGSAYKNAFSVDHVGNFIGDLKQAARIAALDRIKSEDTSDDTRDITVPKVKLPKTKYEAPKTPAGAKAEAFAIATAGGKEYESSEFQKIFDDTHGSMMQLHDAALATDAAFESGMIGIENYSMRMADLTAETAQLKLEMGDATFFDTMMGSLDMVRDGFQNVATSISQSFGGLFKTLSDGFADSLGRAIVYGDDLAESMKNVAKSAMAELISSIVKMGVQWVVTTVMQAVASKGALVATTAANVAAASASAAAWAPAAALASLASFGANSGPANAGIAGTSAFAKSMAVLPGFKMGGYTGDYGRNDIAGVVHGGEFVMTAESVNRIGVNNLESLQRGDGQSQKASVSGTGSDSKPAEAPQNNIYNIIDPDMIVDALNTAEGTDAVINIITNNPELMRGTM